MKPTDFNSIREDLLKEVSDLAALPYRSVGTEWMLNRKREQLKAWDAHVAEDAETEKALRDLYANLLDEVDITERGDPNQAMRLTQEHGDRIEAALAKAEAKLDEKLVAANVAHLPVPRTPQTAEDMVSALEQSIERLK